MRFCTKRPNAAKWLRLGLWLLLVCATVWAGRAAAEAVPQARLERQSDGLYLTARVPLTLPAGLEDALQRGVPLHFTWQAELRRSRWYWTDQLLASVTRSVRLAYQPLTRRWRVSLGSGPVGEAQLNHALHQNLDNLNDALAAVQRVTHWSVADATQLAASGGETLALRFRLDTGLLPRLFQIGQPEPGEGAWDFRLTLAVPAEGGTTETLVGPAARQDTP